MFLEDLQGAIEDCNESIKLDPYFPTSYFTRSRAKNYIYQVQSRCLDLTKTLELGMTDANDSIRKYCS